MLAPDLLGFGERSLPNGEFLHVEDIDAIMERERIERAVVVGAANGGSITIDLAVSNPTASRALPLAPALVGWGWSEEMRMFSRPLARRC